MFAVANIATIAVAGLGLVGNAAAAPAPVHNATLAARQAYTGDATWFYPGVGACGGTNTEYEHVVALNAPQWNGGANCWRTITIQAYGKQIDAAIVDLCPECAYGSLDLARQLFADFTSVDVGRFGVTWWFK